MFNKSKFHYSKQAPRYSQRFNIHLFNQPLKKNMVNLNFQQQISDLPETSYPKLSPYLSRPMISDRREKYRNQAAPTPSDQQLTKQKNKQEIKQKIKVRIKAEIDNLLERNVFKLKGFEKHLVQNYEPQQNVSVVGSAVQYPIESGNSSKLKRSINRRVAFSSEGAIHRKAKSSFDHRPETTSDINTNYYWEAKKLLQSQKEQNSYKRSMSTNIRIKSNLRKSGEMEGLKKSDKPKQDGLQPWIISSFADDEQNF